MELTYFCSLIKELKYVLHAPPYTSVQTMGTDIKSIVMSQGMIYSAFF